MTTWRLSTTANCEPTWFDNDSLRLAFTGAGTTPRYSVSVAVGFKRCMN